MEGQWTVCDVFIWGYISPVALSCMFIEISALILALQSYSDLGDSHCVVQFWMQKPAGSHLVNSMLLKTEHGFMQISTDFQRGIKGLVWKSRVCWNENVWERVNDIKFCICVCIVFKKTKTLLFCTLQIHSCQIKEENRKCQAPLPFKLQQRVSIKYLRESHEDNIWWCQDLRVRIWCCGYVDGKH